MTVAQTQDNRIAHKHLGRRRMLGPVALVLAWRAWQRNRISD